jgi:hypothetical protein
MTGSGLLGWSDREALGEPPSPVGSRVPGVTGPSISGPIRGPSPVSLNPGHEGRLGNARWLFQASEREHCPVVSLGSGI